MHWATSCGEVLGSGAVKDDGDEALPRGLIQGVGVCDTWLNIIGGDDGIGGSKLLERLILGAFREQTAL